MGDPFHVELRRLKEATGMSYAELIKLGKIHPQPIQLPKQTLSDWFTGRVKVPKGPKGVEDQDQLIIRMERVAERRIGYEPRGIDWWRDLRTKTAERTEQHGSRVLGQLVEELTDADALVYEVHRSIDPGDTGASAETGFSVLTPYLKRAHDGELRAELAAAAAGSGPANRVIMVVGDSSTGKTRACWEAIRETLPTWRVWHPLTPDRPEALLTKLAAGQVAPRTVIWLNEAQMYLQSEGIGDQVAATLQGLLHEQSGPIVVLGSMWPRYWTELTDEDSTRHAAARSLLTRSREIRIPPDFSEQDLNEAGDQVEADPRLRAAAQSGRRRLTQYLAGVPELNRRYQHADPYTLAIIHAAMDARRLSRWLHLPTQFLRHAAPGYLSEHDWGRTDENNEWFTRALQHLVKPCHGADGVLAPRKAHHGEAPSSGARGFRGYRLADHLEQLGHLARARECPPATFWIAAARTCTDPGVLSDLANAAHDRGRHRRSALLRVLAARYGDASSLERLAQLHKDAGDSAGAGQLRREAADRGDTRALEDLVFDRELAGDLDGAERLAREAAGRGNLIPLSVLLATRYKAGDADAAERLARELADRGSTTGLMKLAELREKNGDPDGAEQLAREAADRGYSMAMPALARYREEAGDPAGAERLARSLANRLTALRELAELRERNGDLDGAERLWRELADHGAIVGLERLVELREKNGDPDGAERLAHELADHDYRMALVRLAELRTEAGDLEGAERLAREAVDRGVPVGLKVLSELREKNGDPDGAERLAREFANRATNSSALARLAELREKNGDPDGAERLARELADRGNTTVLGRLARLREDNGDPDGAERLARELTDRGDTTAWLALIGGRRKAGDWDSARRMATWGLDDDGSPATEWTIEDVHSELGG